MWLPADYSCCVACDDEHPTYFSAQAGGLLCASCAQAFPGASGGCQHGAVLEGLIALRFTELAASNIDPHTAARLLGLAHIWAATHLDCRLRALEFLLGR